MEKPMNNAAKYDLILRALRDELTEEDRATFEQLLSRDPAFRADWASERALDRAISTLPNAPLSSNFTARVLQLASLPEAPAAPARARVRWPILRWTGAMAAILVLALTAARHQHTTAQRQLAENVNIFREVASVISPELPPTEVFANFDSIQRLSIPAESEMDMELLLALQQ
jgi:anti-sigma factor RsiW